VLDGDDIFPGQPSVLDASLAGLSQDGDTPQADVKMLALALLSHVGGGKEAGPLELVLKRAMAEEHTAVQLVRELTALRARFKARTISTQMPAVEDVEVVEPDLTGFTLSHWKLESVLGEGAMARVYLATDSRNGERAAVKVLKQEHVSEPEFVQRFIQEVRAVEAIENPHIVKVTDFGDVPLAEHQRCVFCVMEVLDGNALSDAMSKESFGVVRAVRIAQQTARALHAAHQVGVVHRDVKPENLFLTQQGSTEFVKVLDFGIAKLLKPLGDLPKVGTKAGIVVGTPEYMAPEQALGTGTDGRVDVYAVGLVLYELLAGEQPFKGDTFGKLVLEITQAPVPPLPPQTIAGERLPPGLSSVVLKCLEKNADDRYASAAELADALEPFATPRRSLSNMPAVRFNEPPSEESPISAPNEADLAAAVRPSRAPLFIGAAVVLALLIGVATVFNPFLSFPRGEGQGEGAALPAKLPAPPAVDPEVEKVDPVVAPKMVWLDVVTNPAGAEVKRAGKVLGLTPLRVSVTRVEAPETISVELAKFSPEAREVTLSDDQKVEIELKSLKSAAKKPPLKKKPPKKK